MKQQHIGKILPIEGYNVVFEGDLSITHYQSLTHLYQPLIGVHALSLYYTLVSESQLQDDQSSPQTHHTLMNYISLPLNEIYQARLLLEGIGLLKTYKQDLDQTNCYTYQLITPFSSASFFEDGMLSQLLYHQLGEKKYEVLLHTFMSKYSNQSVKGQDVTANFNDVFEPSENTSRVANIESANHKKVQTNRGPNIAKQEIDFNWLEQMLKQRMLPATKILTTTNKKLMEQMAVLYELTNQEIEKAMLWAINEENNLDSTEFKTACLDLSQTNQKKPNPKIINTKEKLKTTKSDQPIDKEEQFIQMLEQISPKQLLEDLSGNDQASSQDLKVISDVMSKQGLSPGVMNVLVHYVLLKTDMKLTKSYMEKIASHWARKKVTTIRQAMQLAKSEHKKYQQWGNNKQNYYKKTTKKEVIPDWFNERNSNNELKTSNSNQQQNNAKEDVTELLKNYIKDKKSNHL